MVDLERAARLATAEGGLAVVVTQRRDGSPRASVVNAGVLEDPSTTQPVVGFVSRGDAQKLDDLRRTPRATVVFRTGWDWVAVEGDATLVGPGDDVPGVDPLVVVRCVYAAAAGGTPEQWESLDERFVAEAHTAVLMHPTRVYPASPGAP